MVCVYVVCMQCEICGGGWYGMWRVCYAYNSMLYMHSVYDGCTCVWSMNAQCAVCVEYIRKGSHDVYVFTYDWNLRDSKTLE